VGHNLTVTAGTFATNSTSLTVSGNALVSGTLTGSTAPDTITVVGDTTAGGTINLNGGDLSTTNLAVSGTLVATPGAPAETITVTGSVDFSAAGDDFTLGDSTLVMSGAATPVTINAAGEDGVHNLTITKALGTDVVQLLTALGLDNGSGVLTVTTGTLELNGNTLTLGTDLTLSSAAATVAIGTGTLDGATNSRGVTQSAGTITQTSGTFSGTTYGGSGGHLERYGGGELERGHGGHRGAEPDGGHAGADPHDGGGQLLGQRGGDGGHLHGSHLHADDDRGGDHGALHRAASAL
jgi:hypothetical protein